MRFVVSFNRFVRVAVFGPSLLITARAQNPPQLTELNQKISRTDELVKIPATWQRVPLQRQDELRGFAVQLKSDEHVFLVMLAQTVSIDNPLEWTRVEARNQLKRYFENSCEQPGTYVSDYVKLNCYAHHINGEIADFIFVSSPFSVQIILFSAPRRALYDVYRKEALEMANLYMELRRQTARDQQLVVQMLRNQAEQATSQQRTAEFSNYLKKQREAQAEADQIADRHRKEDLDNAQHALDVLNERRRQERIQQERDRQRREQEDRDRERRRQEERDRDRNH